jgi:hypothetical protein
MANLDKSGSLNRNAPYSSISQIIRRLGSELTATPDSEAVSRSELLARYLWELALTKQVQLTNGTIITATNGEWIDIVFRIIERMEGKPLQPISADVNQGLVINRIPRMDHGLTDRSRMAEAVTDPRVKDGILVLKDEN